MKISKIQNEISSKAVKEAVKESCEVLELYKSKKIGYKEAQVRLSSVRLVIQGIALDWMFYVQNQSRKFIK